MRRSKGFVTVTVILLLMSSVLVLFAAGCVDFSQSEKYVDLTEAPPGETLHYSLRPAGIRHPTNVAIQSVT